MMKDNNTLFGFHVKSKDGEPLKLHPKKYIWHIPKKLRGLDIRPGDIVGIGKPKAPILVAEVFREDVGEPYKSISGLYERAPKKEK